MSEAKEASFIDPYVYRGSAVLRNLLALQTPKELELAEYRYTFAQRTRLEQEPITGSFDFARLKETHRRLFQDVYVWAGEPRIVEIRKGDSQFHAAMYIETATSQTFDWLADTELLSPNVNEERFIVDAANLLEKINYIHPFRDGNGRAQRAFLDQIAAQSGRTLAWRNISREDHLRASVNAFRDGHGEALRSVIRHALRPPIDGLSPLDAGTYTTSEPIVTEARKKDKKE